MFVEFTQWTPDYNTTDVGELTDILNAVPTLRGYKGAPSPSSIGITALPETCYGAELLSTHSGTDVFFAGTATKLYKKNASAWTDVTRTSGDYSLTASEEWCFTQQGDITLAVSRAEYTQKFNHTTPDTDFSDLTAMPLCSIAEAVGQFVLIGDYINPSGSVNTPDGWACSAIGDYTNWTASVDDQCVYGRLLDTPGKITGIKRLADYAIYYKKRSMYLARYTGTPDVWTFSLISDVIGAESQQSIVRVGTTHYFLSYDNFWSFNSSQVVPIGDPIKKWFYANSNPNFRHLSCGAHDITNELVYWYFPSTYSEVLDSFVAYNYRNNKWGYGTVETPIDVVSEIRTDAPTYTTLLSQYPLYSNITGTLLPYGNLTPPGGTPFISIFDTSNNLKILAGVSTSSIIKTNDYGNESRVATIRGIRPRFYEKPSAAACSFMTRDTLGDDLVTREQFPGGGNVVDLSSNNSFDAILSARWHRASMLFFGDYEIVGFDVDIRGSGKE